MTDLFSHGGNITVKGKELPASSVQLGQLAIPGSHDSAADNMGDFADECQGASFFQKNFGKQMTRSYARTQHHDLYTQARLGIRSFDIRPYYNGRQLRTCHTLDAGSFESMFEGQGGLERFFDEHPQEVAIINLSHFRPKRGDEESKHDRGIAVMAKYLREHVCPRAFRPIFAFYAAAITLQAMWNAHKDYVVFADNDEGLYTKLRAKGVDCLYNTNRQISGGYPDEHKRIEYGDEGKYSSTNLWWGLYDEVFCERLAIINNCDYGHGFENADTVRHASEKVLLDQLRESRKEQLREGRKALHETSYIWAYGSFAGFGDYQTAKFRANLNDSSLIAATEQKQMVVDDGLFVDTKVRAGLLPYSKDFINRLETSGDRKDTGLGVNIVNMDAVGRSGLSFEGFVSPLLQIDRKLLSFAAPELSVSPDYKVVFKKRNMTVKTNKRSIRKSRGGEEVRLTATLHPCPEVTGQRIIFERKTQAGKKKGWVYAGSKLINGAKCRASVYVKRIKSTTVFRARAEKVRGFYRTSAKPTRVKVRR